MQTTSTHDVAKELYAAFRFYNEISHYVGTAAASALNIGEPVDG